RAGQGVTNGGIITGGGQIVFVVATVVPTVVGDQGVGQRGSLLQVLVRKDRAERIFRAADAEFGVDGHSEDVGSGRHAAELAIGGRHDRAGSVGDGIRMITAAGNDAGDISAVAIEVRARVREIGGNARSEVRMRHLHAAVVDIDQNALAGQTKV